jgi:hypothetical protein
MRRGLGIRTIMSSQGGNRNLLFHLRALELGLGQTVPETGCPPPIQPENGIPVGTWSVSPWSFLFLCTGFCKGFFFSSWCLVLAWDWGTGQYPLGHSQPADLENSVGIVTMGPASGIPDTFEMWPVLDTSRGAWITT